MLQVNLSTILTETDLGNPNDPDDDSLKNSYIYDSGGNVLAQRYYSDPNYPDYYEQFFYVADRLGSVRLVIDANGDAANSYSYNPFGLDLADQCVEDPNVPNPFKFTGQWFDKEIGQYYLRARMYDPALMRFTDRDPVEGKYKAPLTLHPYLYCGNNSINYVDADGRVAVVLGVSVSGDITATDWSYGFTGRPGLQGIDALITYNSILLPAMVMISDHFGVGGTVGVGVAIAWDHTKSFNDGNAWSWGMMQWGSAGASVSSGRGASLVGDIGISNATNVSQLGGQFVEGGGSGTFGNLFTVGGTVSRGLNPDGSLNDIWLGTASFGGGTSPGYETHAFVGNTWVQEYEF